MLRFNCSLRPAPGGVAPQAPITPAELFAAQVGLLETDLATLLQRRAEAKGAELAIIDYQIDLRVIERWMLAAGALAQPDSQMQACVALRMANLQSIGEQVGQRLQMPGRALASTQLNGLKSLHQLSYDLPDIREISTIDAVCKSLSPALILAANPTPAEVRNLPPMRRQPLAVPPRRSVCAAIAGGIEQAG